MSEPFFSFSAPLSTQCYPNANHVPKFNGMYVNKYGDTLYLTSNTGSVLPLVPYGNETTPQALLDAGFTGIFVTGDATASDTFKIKDCEVFDDAIVMCNEGLLSSNFNWNGDPPLSYLKSITPLPDGNVFCSYNTIRETVCQTVDCPNVSGSKINIGLIVIIVVLSILAAVGIWWFVILTKEKRDRNFIWLTRRKKIAEPVVYSDTDLEKKVELVNVIEAKELNTPEAEAVDELRRYFESYNFDGYKKSLFYQEFINDYKTELITKPRMQAAVLQLERFNEYKTPFFYYYTLIKNDERNRFKKIKELNGIETDRYDTVLSPPSNIGSELGRQLAYLNSDKKLKPFISLYTRVLTLKLLYEQKYNLDTINNEGYKFMEEYKAYRNGVRKDTLQPSFTLKGLLFFPDNDPSITEEKTLTDEYFKEYLYTNCENTQLKNLIKNSSTAIFFNDYQYWYYVQLFNWIISKDMRDGGKLMGINATIDTFIMNLK